MLVSNVDKSFLNYRKTTYIILKMTEFDILVINFVPVKDVLFFRFPNINQYSNNEI